MEKILIVDDSEMNRALLTEILEGQYDITEAENGMQAVEILAENETDCWFVLLDIMMPEMDGFDVLNYINKHYWNDRVVVIMISSDDSAENINHAYDLGAFDYISRPFDPMIVRKRVENTLFLYERQHDLEKAVKEQIYEQQKSNDLMVLILSHIVEFRNGESGMHVQHVKDITKLLLKQLVWCTDRYSLSEADIAVISMGSALHDIGKVAIPEEILNKPGKLTEEEFEVMKTHTEIGYNMLLDLPIEQVNSPLVKVAFEICRWHHERYDGKGYPDGLKEEEIPISAQVVSLADVYDALVSERCYKKAFSHEEALTMILEGKCGTFNPFLLQCLNGISGRLKKLYTDTNLEQDMEKERYIKDKSYNVKLFESNGMNVMQNPTAYMKLLYVDPLTNIYNRRYYKEYIQTLPNIEAVALIDVNYLEQINDNYGHDVGDLVLQHIAKTLLSLIRRNDNVIRYGSDEFLIVFSNMNKESFRLRLEEIRWSLDALEIDGYPQLQASVSIGGVYGEGEPEEFFDMVDKMLKQLECTKEQVSICFLDENRIVRKI